MAIIKVKTSGITADAVTDALIADDVVGTEHLTANEVDTAALKADAVTGAQLADDAVNSEHYTDGSVDTAHIADANITKAKLADSIDIFAGTSLTAADLGSGIHVRTADSSATANGDADELVIENGTSGASAGISILSATDGYGSINFGDSGDDNIGLINYDHPNNAMKFFTNAAEKMRIQNNGSIQFHNTPPIKTFDFGSSSTVTIADGGHIEFADTSGIWIVTEQSQTGASAILIAGGGQAAVASQIGSTYTSDASSGTYRFFRQSGAGYRLKNDQGNSCVFGICHISCRNSN